MLIFVDCEARGTSPVCGRMTEFGCVAYPSLETFHGRLYESRPDPSNPAIPIVGYQIRHLRTAALELVSWLHDVGSPQKNFTMVSDNPAFDFMWIAGMFDVAGIDNPFGYSARRIGDYYAGLVDNWGDTQSWKSLRKTPHDHNPVNDALGNAEAFRELRLIESANRG